MDRKVMKKMEMAARVAEFQRAHPFADRNQAAIARRFEERLVEAQSLFSREHRARNAASAATQHRKALRKKVAAAVRIVSRLGSIAAEGDARLASRFQGSMPNRGNVAFVAFAKALLGVANEHAEVLIRGGVLRTQLAAFAEDLAEFETALHEATGLGRELRETRSALRHAIADLGKLVRHLDLLQDARFAGDASLMATWASVRAVASAARRRTGDDVVTESASTPAIGRPIAANGGSGNLLPGDGGQSRVA